MASAKSPQPPSRHSELGRYLIHTIALWSMQTCVQLQSLRLDNCSCDWNPFCSFLSKQYINSHLQFSIIPQLHYLWRSLFFHSFLFPLYASNCASCFLRSEMADFPTPYCSQIQCMTFPIWFSNLIYWSMVSVLSGRFGFCAITACSTHCCTRSLELEFSTRLQYELNCYLSRAHEH